MDYKIKEETLTGIAEAIRSKTGKTEEILAADFAGNINSIDTSKPEETKEVLLDFSGGDMEVVPTTGNVISKVTIPQPENLLPENIKSGQIIAGIEGTLANQTILENIPIALDFSNGNQTVEAAEGTLVKSATIQKPETLIPENIAEGVNVAGIIGALAAGNASPNIVYNSGTFTAPSAGTATYIVEHNLGVVPDIVLLYTSAKNNSTSYSTLQEYCGFSSSFANATGSKLSHMFMIAKPYTAEATSYTFSQYIGYSANGCIDSTASAFVSMVNSANKDSFTIKSSGGGVNLMPSSTYTWIAIGGLT